MMEIEAFTFVKYAVTISIKCKTTSRIINTTSIIMIYLLVEADVPVSLDMFLV